jgi:hypothetical protein
MSVLNHHVFSVTNRCRFLVNFNMGKIITMAVIPVAVACVGYAAMKTYSLRNSKSLKLVLRKTAILNEDVIIGCSSLAGMYQVSG